VIERGPWSDVGLEQNLDQSLIEIEPRSFVCPVAERNDSRPGDENR
jgi:hypothetical protein